MSVSLSTSTGVYLYFPIISSAFHGSSNLYKAEHSMWACLEAPRATSRRSTFHLQQHQRRRVTRPYGRMPEDPRIISHKRTSIINTLCASCVHRLRHSGPRSTAATLLELMLRRSTERGHGLCFGSGTHLTLQWHIIHPVSISITQRLMRNK